LENNLNILGLQRFRAFVSVLLCLAIMSAWQPAQAEIERSEMEVWLVTYGPGEIYWQRFGHNALWIRDAGLGLDHVFNFGFFDFEQEAFYRRFLQGRLWYFSAAQEAQQEFSQYINENRSIRAQRLGLSEDQSLRLADYLLQEVQPENRDYLYDYYTNNCSTRIRDALDLALEGRLAAEFRPVAAAHTWRDHTRRLTAEDFWLYLGLETSLGAKIDQPITRWDEFFIPSELASAVADAKIYGDGGERSLVQEDVILYQSTLPDVPPEPARTWPRYLFASLSLLTVSWLGCMLAPGLISMRLVRSWLVIGGLAGCVIAYFWIFTDHEAARPNLNLLVLNPLWLIFGLWKHHRPAGILLLLASVLVMLMRFFPPDQYNLDVLAAFLPLNIASGLVLLGAGSGTFRHQSRPADQPGARAAADL